MEIELILQEWVSLLYNTVLFSRQLLYALPIWKQIFFMLCCFFSKFFSFISNNLLGVGMLSHSKRVGAVCRASTESRPRDAAAATHALLPVGCRITRLRIGWTKTTITILIYYVIYFIIYYMEPHALLPIRCRITRLRVGWTKTTTILSVFNNHHYH